MINDGITGKTAIYGIMGYPVEHSLSPIIHNTTFRYLKMDSCYIPWSVFPEKFESALRGAQDLGVKGLNVTIPHKEAAFSLCDEVSDEVKAIGAVNTIVFDNDAIKGYNTDADGFAQSLKSISRNFDNKNILIFGAGGGSRAIAFALGKLYPTSIIYITNRTPEKAEMLIQHFNKFFNRNDLFRTVSSPVIETIEFSLIVNTTPSQSNYVNQSVFSKSIGTAVDIAYSAHETPFVATAKKYQWDAYDGLEMLIFQAAQSFNLWTNKLMPIDVTRKALYSYIGRPL